MLQTSATSTVPPASSGATPTGSAANRKSDGMSVCLHIMNMLHMLPASTFRLFEPLLALSMKGEKALGIEVGVVLYSSV